MSLPIGVGRSLQCSCVPPAQVTGHKGAVGREASSAMAYSAQLTLMCFDGGVTGEITDLFFPNPG